MLGQLARSLHGSGSLFEASGRAPQASINFVTCHDGFTLTDLVTYQHRHNRANGEGNRDGHRGNCSDNLGVEGPSQNALLIARRARRRRCLMATLMLMQGTPMLLAGDENGHSQHGNNNAYCQDNPTTWLAWAERDDGDFRKFVQRLIAIRFRYPALRQTQYLHGRKISPETGFADIQWLAPSGAAMTTADWQHSGNRGLGLLLGGQTVVEGEGEAVETLLALFNASEDSLDFVLPKPLDGAHWAGLLTTSPTEVAEDWLLPGGATMVLEPQSLSLFGLHGERDRPG